MPRAKIPVPDGMNIYYLSLTRGLYGCYVKFYAESEEVVRNHAAEYFGQIWGGIYTAAYFMEIIRKRYPSASRIINDARPIVLTSPDGSWE